jgi:hypothetical protein
VRSGELEVREAGGVSHLAIGSDKRISQHLSRPVNHNSVEVLRSAVLRVPIPYSRGVVAIHQSHSA